METVDVAVVGAGPAGASAALAARRAGARVLLLDRADFPRDKACGDGIAAHALDVLAELGVSDAVSGYRAVPALRLVAPGGGNVARRLPRPAYTVPRRVFDARLVAAARSAGAELRRHAVRRIECAADGLVVLDGTLAARAVVGADGAGSVIRRALGHGANPDGHLALAIRGYAPDATAPDEQRIVTSAAHWPGYAWSFPIGDGRANVGYGEVLAGRPLRRTELLDRLAALLPEIDPAAVTGLRAHHLPLSTRRPAPGRGRIVLAGDALSLVNPFTGEGIFYAVLSGALAGAAAATAPQAAADRYAAALRTRLGRHLRDSSAVAWLARRALVVDGVVRAADRDARVFRVLVELGLGDGRLDARTLTMVAGAVAGSAGRHFRRRL
ncbi:geranylgeranyl reductase family protein [Plantactinospora endophytica]|uniref:FAD-binding domain-containing protein n=1 Tax=Plantactinospora endophytica TaxID=673535 RepID=A0ABQ4DTH2_9ACTN|nr:geranylgeranyl reductase family protein [Plantactinospora endophytica]GIG85747.1 hypothetical protein Pen02_06830 [Plantactinospora endophytica]